MSESDDGGGEIVVVGTPHRFTLSEIAWLGANFGSSGNTGWQPNPADRDSDRDGTPDSVDEMPYDANNSNIVVSGQPLPPLPPGFRIAPFGSGKLMIAPDGTIHMTPEYQREVALGPQIDWVGVSMNIATVVGAGMAAGGTLLAALSIPVQAYGSLDVLRDALRERDQNGDQRPPQNDAPL